MSLNPQQLKVLQLVAAGYFYNQIGDRMYLSRKRIEAIALEIKEVLGATTMAHAVSIAYQHNILEVEDDEDMSAA